MKKRTKDAVQGAGGEARASVWRQILVTAFDLVVAGVIGVLGQFVLRVAFGIWVDVHPGSLLAAWEWAPVAFLWTVAVTPPLVVCAVAVVVRLLTRGLSGRLSAIRRRIAGERNSKHRKPSLDAPLCRGFSTGMQSMDLVLGGGGWLRGRFNGIWAVGLDRWITTTFLLTAIAAAQKRGERCAWLGDAIDPTLADRIGVDVSALHALVPDDEDPARFVEIAHGLATSLAKFDLVVIESMPAAHPHWRKAHGALARFARALKQSGVTCVYVTHPADLHLLDGPRRLRFHSSTLLTLRSGDSSSADLIPDARVMVAAERPKSERGSAVTLEVVRAEGITAHQLTPETALSLGLRHEVLTRTEAGGVLFRSERVGGDDAAALRRLAFDPEIALDVQVAITVSSRASQDRSSR